MIRTILTSFLLTLFLASPAQAADTVQARLEGRGEYSRLVFAWPAPVSYTVHQENGGGLLVAFGRPGTLESAIKSDLHVSAVISTPAANLTVKISAPPGGHFRDFAAGNRVIIDVYGAPGAVPTPAVAPVPITPPVNKETLKRPVTEKPAIKIASVTPKPAPVTTATVAPAKSEASAGTDVITLTSTERTGLAVFIRDGNLWIVLDRTALIPPAVSGPHAKQFAFRATALKNGVAFVTALPSRPDLDVNADGGGLIWHVTVGPQMKDRKPVVMRRDFSAGPTTIASASWAMAATAILDVPDPAIGATLKIATVANADQFTGPAIETTDFTALRSAAGVALQPKVDDLIVSKTPAGVVVTRPRGLNLLPQRDVNLRQMRADMVQDKTAALIGASDAAAGAVVAPLHRLFDFDRWSLGSLAAMTESQNSILANLKTKDTEGQAQDLLTLAKMNLGNDRGPEAIGYLDFAVDQLPALADAPEFKALYGVADALSGRYEDALAQLNSGDLKDYGEVDYWRAYALTWLEDWRQAYAAMPKDNSILLQYPKPLMHKVGLKLAEAALHAGDTRMAQTILDALAKDKKGTAQATLAALDYLDGELFRQKGDTGKTIALWTPLTTGDDHFYRAKSGLALTNLQLQKGDIKPAQGIDRLEGLRYVWRGDELEARINYLLGKLYLENKQYMKGFGILKDAAAMSPNADIGHEIESYMRDHYKNLLMNDTDISPVDAAEIYEEYPELQPQGDDGDKMAQRLAEKLVEADLLSRAGDLLQNQIDKRLTGANQARVATRLAAIDLLDHNPQKALSALDVAGKYYAAEADKNPEDKTNLRHVQLMLARALSQSGKTQDALDMLGKFPPDPDVNAARADIAWQAGLWDQAAAALQDMITDQAIDPAKALSQKQADLILNRAVALNLSGNHVALANLRTRFGGGMAKTSRAKLFDVVTAPRESPLLSDRQTLANIVSEADIFKDFLTSYQKSGDISP